MFDFKDDGLTMEDKANGLLKEPVENLSVLEENFHKLTVALNTEIESFSDKLNKMIDSIDGCVFGTDAVHEQIKLAKNLMGNGFYLRKSVKKISKNAKFIGHHKLARKLKSVNSIFIMIAQEIMTARAKIHRCNEKYSKLFNNN